MTFLENLLKRGLITVGDKMRGAEKSSDVKAGLAGNLNIVGSYKAELCGRFTLVPGRIKDQIDVRAGLP